MSWDLSYEIMDMSMADEATKSVYMRRIVMVREDPVEPIVLLISDSGLKVKERSGEEGRVEKSWNEGGPYKGRIRGSGDIGLY